MIIMTSVVSNLSYTTATFSKLS